MSFIRRVKSFSSKKTKDVDITLLRQQDRFTQQHPRPRRKTNLHRQKSFSMESVPLRIDLERNDLFQKQKHKLEKEERLHKSPTNVHRKCVKILEKRDSVSLDENNFSQYIKPQPSAQVFPSLVELRNSDKYRNENHHRFNTAVIIRDLITEFGEDSKNVDEGRNKPGSFPVFEEDEVQVRQSRPFRQERPQTFTPPTTVSTMVSMKAKLGQLKFTLKLNLYKQPLTASCKSNKDKARRSIGKRKPLKFVGSGKKKEDTFDFRGPFGLEIGKDQCIKIKSNETFRMTKDQLQILDENQCVKSAFKNTLKKGTKIICKTEVEMLNTDKTVYRFLFETSEDAKLFIEREKLRPIITKDKSAGPFSITLLLKLLKKRSSRDLLESKGIIKNEPIFGNTLQELCDPSNPVPEVVRRIVQLIEEPDNIKSMGLYRASANLAVVQHIRCEINCGRWEILEKYRKDVDVLAGTLKLFFRELKEPLIPYETFQVLLATIRGTSTTAQTIGNIIDSLPQPNRETLIYIIEHLLKVCSFKNENKMDVHNMAICWGPSLIMFPENCIDLVAQTAEFTTITEYLLDYFNNSNSVNRKIDDPPLKEDFTYQVVQKFIEVIESNLNTEGIYRKSGSNTRIDRIMKQIEKKQINELDFSKIDIHDLCCVLKKFLGSLKEPLIPNEIFYYYCENCDKLSEQSLREEIKNKLCFVPQKDVLLLLLEHLRKVIDHEKFNKMTLNVTTDIWMTTLANPIQQQYKKKIQKFSKLFEILINLNDHVLPDVLPESESLSRIRESQYDNVLDISNTADSFNNLHDTKL